LLGFERQFRRLASVGFPNARKRALLASIQPIAVLALVAHRRDPEHAARSAYSRRSARPLH
jgi:hypothetical protein